MRTVRPSFIVVVAICALCGPSYSSAIESVTGPPNSSVTIQQREAVTTRRNPSLHAVTRAFGKAPLRPGLAVVFEDKHPFGERTGAVPAWLFSDSVRVGAPGEVVDVVAVVDSSGRLIAVYTLPKPVWVQPVGAVRDPEAEARSGWWRMSPATSDEFRLTVSDVLNVLSAKLGVEPSQPGQIVVRPRRVASLTPATVEDGVVKPMYPEGPAWIVEVLGMRVDESDTFYWSGLLGLIDDRTGDLIKLIFLP